MTPSVLAVIVLYQMSARDSVCVSSLARALAAVTGAAPRVKVLLVENGTASGKAAPAVFTDESYCPFADNFGLAHAYNLGLEMAQEEGFEWMLTLDQDTDLPRDFVSEMVKAIQGVCRDPQIGAVVPLIQGSGRTLSPYKLRWGALPRPLADGYSGTPEGTVYALNSGSLFRVSALRQAGGYDERFWLDASDHAIFHALSAYGKRVYVAGDVRVRHRLSLIEEGQSMSAERYDNVLASEAAFLDLRMGRLAQVERTLRLPVRMARQMRRKEYALARVSWKHLWLRLLHTRRYRLELWERGLAGRIRTAETREVSRPMVSVCMASFNGERYIAEQIASVLPQLHAGDELVVVDDASTDSTRAILEGFGDRRIRLVLQAENRGLIETFERAVRSATGDILFLCDGDDIWAAEKVAKVLDAFATNPRATIVCTGLRLIDGEGRPIESGEYMKHRGFTASVWANVIRNRYQGSTMAFRSELVREVLPFPKRRLFLHDAWIGLCNALAGGETVYLDEPLLDYRRHSENASRTLGRGAQVMKRAQLTIDLLVHWLNRRRENRCAAQRQSDNAS